MRQLFGNFARKSADIVGNAWAFVLAEEKYKQLSVKSG